MLIAVAAYSCGAHAPRRAGLAALALLVVVLQVGLGFDDFPNAELAIMTLAPWWAGWEVQRRRRIVRELAARTQELEAEQEAFTRLSVRRERARIAGELHDIVTHHLAVMVIQAGAGRMADPADARGAGDRLATICDSGRQALADMARLVELLDAPGPGRLALLLERAQAGEPAVEVQPLPADVELAPELEETACRVVQEGLTNAMKHAAGGDIQVRLVLDEHLLIEIRNGPGSGAQQALAATGSGLGLAGMRERVRELDGSMSVGPEDGGRWCLRVRLPAALAGAAPAPSLRR
jgi:signal transduction histidine kinase